MRKALLVLVVAAIAALGYQAATRQGTHPVTGRKIAGVMGMAGAAWLVRPERIAEENPDGALDAMSIRPGMVIADLGSGVGYMTLRMAKRVGPTGKIYGVDLQPGMLAELERNAKENGITNVIPVLGEPADPKLPAGQIDMILMVDVYHEVSQPQAMIRKLREALKPDGRLILLEYRAEDPSIPINPDHKMTVEQVRAEIEPEGFKLQPPVETLPRQHLLILTKAPR